MADAAFWDRIAERYAARPVGNPDAYEATLARVSAWLTPEARVIELGCGTGSTALRLAGAVAAYRGTDVAPGMIAIARAKDAPPQLSFEVADATGGLTGGADVVLAFNLLHLVNDLPGLLAEVHEALPEGGLFISKTPCLGGKWWLRPVIAAMQWLGKAPSPVAFLRTDMLEAALLDAGFAIEERGDYPARPPSRFLVARKGG
ncbi:class I SAM-dependent methyltransferase [Aestuariicoccus sp. MJ-SS9]|uniref:class I SAM-dependent methyltransferase n=1 Tax=Aestuariicoccus sp. MJ-SS9 TaxID=3079855 RepID=UPI002910258E|nr:class I SAM-dependent methyltransferase [Aestuariicoccus sp. MJ-SS9]MDU8910158.1 class I SAM-dependent methyltransferase [Aestuariicoccus sp. MJ-SS9]